MRWRQQPTGQIGIDWSHPITRGLRGAFLPTQSPGAAFDLAAWQQYTHGGGNEKLAAGPAGMGMGYVISHYIEGTNGLKAPGAKSITLTGGFEVMGVITPKTLQSEWIVGQSGQQPCAIRSSYSSPNYYFEGDFHNTGGDVTIIGATARAMNQSYVVHASGNSSGSALYVNGVLDASSASGYNSGSFLWFPVGYNGAIGSNTLRHLSLCWQRQLSQNERIALVENPWQIFLPMAQRRFYLLPPGGSVFNVSLAEAASAADTSSATQVAVASLSESGSAADTLSAIATFLAAVAEAGAAADTVSSGASTIAASLAEAAAAADTISATLNAAAAIAESGAAADTITAAFNALVSLTEAGSAADTVATGAQIFSVSVAEAAAAADAISAAQLAVAQLSEAGASADTLSALATLQASLGEAGTAVDQLIATGGVSVAILETANAQDVVNWISSGRYDEAERLIVLPYDKRTIVAAYGKRIIVDAYDRRVVIH